MTPLALLVNDRRYEGWRSISVTRTIRSAAGSFELEISDRWSGQSEPWPIVEEDECRVELAGEVIIDGWIDSRAQSISAADRSFSVSGKDRAGALVECAALLSPRWSFRNSTALEIARAVSEPFGIGVRLADGIGPLTPARKLVVNPGETAWEVIQRAAQTAGLLAISDGAGGLVLSRAGSERAESIVEGRNVLSGNIDYQAAERFAVYVVYGQAPGDDNASGNSTRIRASVADEGVRRDHRRAVIRTPRAMNKKEARQYLDWIARVNAARAESLSITVQGWKQTSGAVWPVNALCTVNVPSLGVSGEMLIAETRFTYSSAGEMIDLALVRPDAFSPDPSAIVRNTGTKWKKQRGTE